MDPYIIEAPEQITLSRIQTTRAPWLRRILVERYRHGSETDGAAAFLCDAGATRGDVTPSRRRVAFR